METISIGEAADLLHVSPETLRRYEKEGKLTFDVIYTPGGHRKYPVQELLAYKHGEAAEIGFPVDREDRDLDIDELYDKYTTEGPDGCILPEPHEMTQELFRAEYDFMQGADLESPVSFEWLAKLKEEQARRLKLAGLAGSGEQIYQAKRLRHDALHHFGIEACEGVIAFPI